MAHCEDVKNFQRILECPICLERIRDPRCLPCLHSFCEKCIGQHMDEKQENGLFPCPMCNLKFQVPKDGVTGFSRNLYLVQMSELFPEESEVKCDFCKLQDVDIAATSMCMQCRDHLCLGCAEYHCRSKLTFGHKVVSLEEIRNGQHLQEIRQFQKVHCPKHAEKLIEVFCVDCAKPVCLLCAMLEHKQHEMKNLEEAAVDASDVMRGLLGPWEMASEHSTMLSAERKKALDSLDDQEERLIGEMKQLYKTFKDEIVEEIDLKMDDSIANLKAEIAKARKQAEVAYNEAEFSRMTINSTLKYSKEILDSAQDAEKLQQFHDIKTRLENLDIRKLETEVVTPVLKLQPDTLAIPDLTIKTIMKPEEERVTSFLPEQTRLPDVRDRASLLRSLGVRLSSETRSGCLGLAISGERLIITDYGNNNVKVFNRSNGSFMFEVDKVQHALQNPRGVACNGKGEMFVTADSINGVVRYNSKGQVMKVTPNVISGFSGVTCHNDQLAVADYGGGRVLMTDLDCNIGEVISKESLGLSTFNPWYVCFDNDGHLVVNDDGQGRVHVIDCKQPAIVRTFSEQLSSLPFGACVDVWGHVLVADYDRNHIVIMSGQSDIARVIITNYDVSKPVDLAIIGPGEIAVLEQLSGCVKVFKYADV